MKRSIPLLLLIGAFAADTLAQDAVPKPGQFLWHELLTSDKDGAIDFYSHVVGWVVQDYEFADDSQPPYTLLIAEETPIGGIMAIDTETMGELHPNWMAYISTPDVDATVQQAKDLGASVLFEPMDVPDVGRFAVLADPQGASFALLQPVNDSTPPRWPPGLQSFSWNELSTSDSEAALGFYQRLFGWEKTQETDMGDGWMYRIYGHNDRTYGGMYDQPADVTTPPRWLYYVTVADLEGAIARVQERGGQVLYGPVEVPGGDMIAQCLDPQGAAFALHASGE